MNTELTLQERSDRAKRAVVAMREKHPAPVVPARTDDAKSVATARDITTPITAAISGAFKDAAAYGRGAQANIRVQHRAADGSATQVDTAITIDGPQHFDHAAVREIVGQELTMRDLREAIAEIEPPRPRPPVRLVR